MKLDIPNTPKQLEEAIFESWFRRSGEKVLFFPPLSLSAMGSIIAMYENYVGATHEDDVRKREKYATEFEALTKHKIEDFLAFRDRIMKEA